MDVKKSTDLSDEKPPTPAVAEGELEDTDDGTLSRLLWKLDMRLLPLLCLTYALQSIDKTTLSYAAVFGLEEDLHLKGTEFSWLGALFYLGYLVWEFPTNVFLQKLPINYFMAGTVSPPTPCARTKHRYGLIQSPGGHLGNSPRPPRHLTQLPLPSRSTHIPWRL
jgi:hypothetical protein